jgi:hypothetical protein
MHGDAHACGGLVVAICFPYQELWWFKLNHVYRVTVMSKKKNNKIKREMLDLRKCVSDVQWG